MHGPARCWRRTVASTLALPATWKMPRRLISLVPWERVLCVWRELCAMLQTCRAR